MPSLHTALCLDEWPGSPNTMSSGSCDIVIKASLMESPRAQAIPCRLRLGVAPSQVQGLGARICQWTPLYITKPCAEA